MWVCVLLGGWGTNASGGGVWSGVACARRAGTLRSGEPEASSDLSPPGSFCFPWVDAYSGEILVDSRKMFCKGLPAWLTFLLWFVGPPAALVAVVQTFTHKSLLVALLVVGYEALFFLCRFLFSFLEKVWLRLEEPLSEAFAHWLTVRAKEVASHSLRRCCLR